MGKVGLGFASFFLTGFCVGLGFTCYHYVENKDARAVFFEEHINENENYKKALAFDEASDEVRIAAVYMGDVIVDGDEVIVINKPDLDRVIKNLTEAMAELYKTKDIDMVNIVSSYNERIVALDDVKEEPYEFKDIESELKEYSTKLEKIAAEYEPNLDGIRVKAGSYSNRNDGLPWAMGFGSGFIIACGIWTAIQAEETIEEISYSRPKKRKNKP